MRYCGMTAISLVSSVVCVAAFVAREGAGKDEQGARCPSNDPPCCLVPAEALREGKRQSGEGLGIARLVGDSIPDPRRPRADALDGGSKAGSEAARRQACGIHPSSSFHLSVSAVGGRIPLSDLGLVMTSFLGNDETRSPDLDKRVLVRSS